MGLFARSFQFVKLPVLMVADLFSKPTSRILNDRLKKAIAGDLALSGKYALKKGANPEFESSLLLAAEKGNAPLVRALLEHGANPNLWYTRTRENGLVTTQIIANPLVYALQAGHTGAVKALLDHKSDPWTFEHKTVTDLGYAPHVSTQDALAIAQSKCYDDICGLLETARKDNPQPAPAPAATSSAVAKQQPATDDFNAKAAPSVSTNDDIIVSGPLKLKNPPRLR
ncbi:MAG: ankyrin repeat domain-containing protein [Alphaproteobacteria bacterium]